MKSQKRWTLLIFVLTFSVLACAPCGLGSYLERLEASEAAIAEAEAVVESVAEEVTENLEEAAPTDEAVMQESAVGAEESAEGEDSSVAADDSAPADAEGVALPVNTVDIQGLLGNENVESYQVEYYFKAEGPGETAEVTLFSEATSNPSRFHLIMEIAGGAAAQSDLNRMEIYVITQDGKTTMYLQSPQDQSWTAITTNQANDAFGMLPISPYTQLPPQSQYVGQEEVNGILTNYYTYNQQDYLGTLSGLREAHGELWITEDEVIIKLIQELHADPQALLNTPDMDQVTDIYMEYQVTKLNDSSINITLPEEALNSSPLGMPGSDSNQNGPPMPDGAEVELSTGNMVSFSTTLTVQEALQFYQNAWGIDNVKITIETPANVMATYNDGQTLNQLIITDENGTTKIIINSQ